MRVRRAVGWTVGAPMVALLLVGCPKVVPEPEVPPYVWPEPEAPPPPPVPSDVDGWYLAQVQGDLAWIDLWGDDAAAMAADAVAEGAVPRTSAVLDDADPELARWVASGVLGSSNLRLFALPEGEAGPATGFPGRLIAAVPARSDEGTLGVRTWLRLMGDPGVSWMAARAGEAAPTGSRHAATGETATPCDAVDASPLPILGIQARTCPPADGCALLCSVLPLPDGARIVATEWPTRLPDGTLDGTCVSTALQYGHGGVAPWNSTCRTLDLDDAGRVRLREGRFPTEAGPTLPVGWLRDDAGELLIVNRFTPDRHDRCLARRPEVGDVIAPATCTTGGPR